MDVAVIIPTYNRPKLLERAVNSALNQTRPVRQVIVVNDGERIPPIPKFTLIETTGGVGPTRARSMAMQFLAPSVRWVCYLDDDDELLPNHVESLSKKLSQGNQFAFSKARYVYPDGTSTQDPEPGNRDPNKRYYDPNALLEQNIAPISSFMHTRDLYEAVGGWDTSLLRMEDWDMWGRMFIQAGPPAMVDEETNVIYKGLGPNRTDSNPYTYSMACHWRDLVADRLRYLASQKRGLLKLEDFDRFRIPKVGVVMPFYNAERYMDEALRSITEDQLGTFRNFEVVAVDDGSSDSTWKRLEGWSERHPGLVRSFRRQRNEGVTRALNFGLLMSRSQYVARMDADDVSLPGRLWKQADFLDRNPDVAIVGTRFWSMDEYMKRVIWNNDVPTNPDAVALEMKSRCCLGHPTVMMRRKVIEDIGGYDESPGCRAVEDYEFWLRALDKGFRIANLPEYLLKYREHGGQVTKSLSETQKKNFENVKARYSK